MRTLIWNRLRPGMWQLIDKQSNEIWGTIIPYKAEHHCKNQFQAMLHPPRTGFNTWTTGIGVASAKRAAIRLLEKGQCAFENFEIDGF